MTTCRVCAEPFDKQRMGQIVCGVKCARKIPIVAKNTLKAEKKADRAKREALKPLSKWRAEAQQAFNAYIRARDHDKPCISCQRFHDGQWHAGHYLSVGARPELRFDELNVSRQCQPCNTHLHGNLALYRAELIKRIGSVAVDHLEGPHPPKKWTVTDLKAIRDCYKQKAKELAKWN